MPTEEESEAISDLLMPQGYEDKSGGRNPGVSESVSGFLGHLADTQIPRLRCAGSSSLGWAWALLPGASDMASWQGSRYPGLLCPHAVP